MNNDFSKKLNERYKRLSELINKTESKMGTLPEGRIYVKRRNNRTYYYMFGAKTDNKEKYISKDDSDLIESLLQKKYLETVLKTAKAEWKVLDKIKKSYPSTVAEDIYERLSEDKRKYVKPIIPTDEQYAKRWEKKPYDKNPIPDYLPTYKTMRGERVRSKSEMIIADRLYLNGIPYKYECPIKVGDEIIHPDFTILRISDRKILYLEHCGMLDDPKYADDLVRRASLYALEGIVMGDRLFYTFESSKTPLDVRVVEALINNQFR